MNPNLKSHSKDLTANQIHSRLASRYQKTIGYCYQEKKLIEEIQNLEKDICNNETEISSHYLSKEADNLKLEKLNLHKDKMKLENLRRQISKMEKEMESIGGVMGHKQWERACSKYRIEER